MKMTKYIYLTLIFLLSAASIRAQVGIKTTTIDGAGILDFSTGSGIILPWIETPSSTDVDGTLIFDTTDNKVKVRVNGAWVDLSQNSGTLDATRTAAVVSHLAKNENIGNHGVIIGAETSTARGVLILESTDKALILPKMASPHLNMINPEPGTIVYDTTANLMCLFNGSEWTFWGI